MKEDTLKEVITCQEMPCPGKTKKRPTPIFPGSIKYRSRSRVGKYRLFLHIYLTSKGGSKEETPVST